MKGGKISNRTQSCQIFIGGLQRRINSSLHFPGLRLGLLLHILPELSQVVYKERIEKQVAKVAQNFVTRHASHHGDNQTCSADRLKKEVSDNFVRNKQHFPSMIAIQFVGVNL